MAIYQTWRGYAIEYPLPGTEFSKYVKGVRKGKVTWTLDYTYAAHYSEKTARKHDENIKSGAYREA